jgi:hypothetical protein
MNTSCLLDGVTMLIPHRFHQSHDLFAGRLAADLSATIALLPTVPPVIAAEPFDSADVLQFKIWTLSVIGALPTRVEKDCDYGHD